MYVPRAAKTLEAPYSVRVDLSAEELDCLIISLQLRENDIRKLRDNAVQPPVQPPAELVETMLAELRELRMLPAELVEATLVDLGALRARLTAELDRRFAARDAARARGADEATADLELDRSPPMDDAGRRDPSH